MIQCIISEKLHADENVSLGHRGLGVVINYDAIIGSNVGIMKQVTIGKSFSPTSAPIIRNNVLCAPCCQVIGMVKIGNNVIIGSGADVIKEVPDDCESLEFIQKSYESSLWRKMKEYQSPI